jgi:D-tyrosyl-tRNA(Tyr) deacylase
MITIIQRVTKASVEIDGDITAKIEKGILALVAVEKMDTTATAEKLLTRILNYRIFADDNDKMNLSLRDIEGDLLIVPQFTLAADTNKGNRPSFTSAAPPEFGLEMFSYLQKYAVETFDNVKFGRFGADMKVSLINDGPVTFTLRV